VWTHHDGNAELSRLERVVTASGNEAAADEGHRGQRVDRGQFADGVEQDDLTGAKGFKRASGLRVPIRAPEPWNAGFVEQRSHCAKALWMADGEDHGQFRIGFEQARPGFKECGFFAFERAAGDNEAQIGGQRFPVDG